MQPNEVIIAIEDSGPGIDAKDTDRIFDAFFTTKPHGMGMGLSICRSIVESHGGRLWASARQPQGSTFYVKLQSDLLHDTDNDTGAWEALAWTAQEAAPDRIGPRREGRPVY